MRTALFFLFLLAGIWLPGRAFSAEIPLRYRPQKNDLRGVWVATKLNLDFGVNSSSTAFRKEYLQVVNTLQKNKMNAIFFQIRPTCDAFYRSAINPVSQYMTGAEGVGYGDFDPLPFMIREAQSRKLEFHAWMNPYRVTGKTKMSKNAYLQTLHKSNFARQNPSCVLSIPLAGGGNLLFLNPGEPKVRRHIVDTVREVAQKYQVDAIHFDDYFYPYVELPADIDRASFQRYNVQKLSLANWRRANVNMLIAEVGKTVREVSRQKKHKIEFGISPFGIWANAKNHRSGSRTDGKESYFTQYADSRGWIKNGYIDYIVPQLYWPFAHQKAPYAALADWWAAQVRGTKVKLYIGQAAYQLGSSRQWSGSEFYNQLRYNQKHPEITGCVWFSYRHLANPVNSEMRKQLSNIINNHWRYF